MLVFLFDLVVLHTSVVLQVQQLRAYHTFRGALALSLFTVALYTIDVAWQLPSSGH